MTKAISADDWDWKVRSAADTMMEYEKIKHEPKLHNAALKELRKRKKEIADALKKNS